MTTSVRSLPTVPDTRPSPASRWHPEPQHGTLGAQARTEEREPGSSRDGITPPLGTDPAILASQIDKVQPWETGPFSGLQAIADTATTNYLTCPVRTATLDVIATMGGQDSGPATDRAGRPGIAIAVDSSDHAVRDTSTEVSARRTLPEPARLDPTANSRSFRRQQAAAGPDEIGRARSAELRKRA
ncbi:hypothetical protein ACFPIJ_13405 [Dactylosporangium cerinum]|uniref:Uncharacterized protein n=1 Tax=Dactylosporangium cerinum TaxID=1434730 RepID=A0ABV9VSR1_9ACTN